MEIFSHSPEGYEGDLVRVETDLRKAIPGYDVTGMAGTAVKEARERVRAALRNSGFTFPLERILTNLSPSDIKKSGAGFDLALALSLLDASGQIALGPGPVLALGELQLDGGLRPVTGVLSAAVQARKAGIATLWVPRENAREASVIRGISIMALDHLGDLKRPLDALIYSAGAEDLACPSIPEETPPQVLKSFRGQPRIKRSLEAAAAGGHNLFLLGPPGSGKTLAARTLKALLPPWTPEEALETTRLWSLAGQRESRWGLLPSRPFRAPHHSSTAEGVLGGGALLRPGEISLAHRGVLFLDEAPEFRTDLLQNLREPMEEGAVQVSRAGRLFRFPSDFQLILAANPCPCGQTGRSEGWCACSPLEKGAYIRKLGGALLDRLDIRLEVKPLVPSSLLEPDPPGGELSAARVAEARQRCLSRRLFPGVPNSRLDLEALETLSDTGREIFRAWSSKVGTFLSARGMIQVWRLALTLRDLERKEGMEQVHLEEALELRGGGGGEYGWF